MNQKQFSTAFEKILKPRIAEEFNLSPLKQSFHVDFITDQGNLIELKLRRMRENRKGESFAISKNQYGKIKRRYLDGQLMFSSRRNGRCCQPTFSYLLLGYRSNKDIGSIKTVDEMIEDMKISEGFLIDYNFIPTHDRSGRKSTFYRLLIDDLNENGKEMGEVGLLNSTFYLHLVDNEDYIPKLASLIFKH